MKSAPFSVDYSYVVVDVTIWAGTNKHRRMRISFLSVASRTTSDL